ncbi:MAG: hypothetical protein LKI80_11705 [Sporolactobacillus sp.]|jgi:hypothetical protein|nr:hypothetical protein [Sporolactobacillus sp.]
MSETSVEINGKAIDTTKGDANTFKGFGYISCNNSSRLLLDYKWEHPDVYRQLLTLLFGGPAPLLNMVKIEMGVDANTSSGTEPATMRSADEAANVYRGAGWQLIADVKEINPNVKTAILRWGEPGWIRPDWQAMHRDGAIKTRAFEAMYQWYKQSIIAAYETYGYLIDYIDPDRNENKRAMVDWLKWFARRLAADSDGFPADFPVKAYQNIKLIAADQNYETNFGDAMVADGELRELIPAVGYHYNTDDGPEKPFTKLADEYNKEVWYSEGIAPMTFARYRVNNSSGQGIGGRFSILDVANRLLKSYDQSRRSLYLFQPAVAAYYSGVNYSHKELICAQEPWSGYLDVDDAGIAMIRHFTDFAVSGWTDGADGDRVWRYVTSACYSGVGGTENLDQDTERPSYMTLAAPDGSDYSVVIVNDSAETKTYDFTLKNLPSAAEKPLQIWETRGRDHQEDDYDKNFLQRIGEVCPETGRFSVRIKPYSLVTLTTLKQADHAYQRFASGQKSTVLDIREGNFLYQDDFSYRTMPDDYLAKRGGTPRYTTDQGGAFEVVRTADGVPVLRQQITEATRALDWEYSYAPNLTVGDSRWMNYRVTVAVDFDLNTVQNSSTANYIGIGLREQTDVKGRLEDAAYAFKLYSDGSWSLGKYDAVVRYGDLRPFDAEKQHELAFSAAGNTLTATVDGQQVVQWSDDGNPVYSGRVKLGCGYYLTQISRLAVERVDGCPPYANERIDDMDDRIRYSGDWDHRTGLGNTEWNRTLSTGRAGTDQPTAFTLTFAGSGFSLIGPSPEPCRLTFFLDGQLLAAAVRPEVGGHKTANVLQLGLPQGRHELQAVVVSGTYTFDAIEIIG